MPSPCWWQYRLWRLQKEINGGPLLPEEYRTIGYGRDNHWLKGAFIALPNHRKLQTLDRH